jgi:hypothetical protein
MLKYKAEMRVEKFSRSGWDTYNDVDIVHLEESSKESLDKSINKFIEDNTKKRYGDFGICLDDYKCSLIRKYTSDESEFE